MRVTVLAAIAAVTLTGCATGPAFVEAPPPSNGKALIYIYRDVSLAAAARDAAFYLNGEKVFDLQTGGYSYVYVTPGNYAITQKWPYWPFDMGRICDAIGISLYVKPGDTRYVRFDTGVGDASCYNCVSIEWRIDEVSASTGSAEIAKEKFSKPDADTQKPH